MLGLAGLGNTWRAAHEVWRMPAVVGEALMALAAVVWALLLLLFILRWVFSREESLGEAHHPVQCYFIGLAGVSTMLIALAALPHSRLVAERRPRNPSPPDDSGRRNHLIWPSNLAAPLALFDSCRNASRPPAA